MNEDALDIASSHVRLGDPAPLMIEYRRYPTICESSTISIAVAEAVFIPPYEAPAWGGFTLMVSGRPTLWERLVAIWRRIVTLFR